MESAREIAIKVIGRVINDNAFSNITLGKELDKSNLNDLDKSLVTEIVYGTIKYKYSIDTILNYFIRSGIKSLDSVIVNILRTAIYQLRFLDKIPSFAAVNEAVNIAKTISLSNSKLVNGVLRNYIRNSDAIFYDEIDMKLKLCFEYSFEKWMVELFLKQYGENICLQILSGLNKTPSITVRVNNLKTDFEKVWQKLSEIGYNIEEGNICPEAIRIIKGKNIGNNILFTEGNITVQDESAMLVAPSMDLKENLIVYDLCSAPGGKTTHISELMNNTGEVYAFDLYKNKLGLIEENMKRLGITNIKTAVMDSSVYDESLNDSCDRILIDAPCSGLGIIRKKPEIKWTKTQEDLISLISLQKNLLKNASRYLKKDGILLYSTCTLNRDENEDNINWFSRNFPEFSIEPLFFGKVKNIIYSKQGLVTVLPDENMDGFFIAKLKRCR